jgi:acyl transferase domain-containing protein
MAVAGGVNLNLHPSKYLRLQQLGMLASTAQSRSLGDGDGLVPGEGVGAVLLKPLSSALRDRDIIHAVIKSTVVNHGGKTGGFTVPNPNAQADLIAGMLEKARIDPRTISYVEVAANGSALGDAIEIAGLTKAFQRFTSDRRFCAIGAVKSNLGHLEAASGIAQLTKVILQLEHRMLVPSLNADPCNPNLHFETTPFYVQQRLSEWERTYLSEPGALVAPRRAAISSFGAGGSNTHILVEEYQSTTSEPAAQADGAPQLIVLSARTEDSLRDYCLRLVEFLRGGIATTAHRAIDDTWSRALRDDLLSITADILRVSRSDIDLDRDLGDYGFDAGHYTALASRLRDRYGIELSASALLRIGNLEATAGYLAAEHRQALQTIYGESRQRAPATADTPTLADIAYTLQTGREPMRERLAIVASSKDVLAERLERFCRGATDIEHLQRARASSATAALVGDDVEGSTYIDTLVRNHKLGKLAQLWVNGVDIDWDHLHAADGEARRPRRVTLPTYPFARHRYWVDDPRRSRWRRT